MFQLNGKLCIDPAILKLSLREAGFNIWWEKYSPNYFRHQCGVDPGEGYLLLKGSDVPTSSVTVPLTIGSVTIPKVVVLKSVELEATGSSPSANNTRLVQVADIRHYLKRTQVKKSYNVVRYYSSEGQASFDESTMKSLGGDSYTNWTWETMLNDLWEDSLLKDETLNLDDAEFPELFPVNYRFSTGLWTHRDAFALILLDLGFTLEPSTGSTWRVVPINSDSAFLSTANGFSNKLIHSNNFSPGHGTKLPNKILFHFLYPEESPVGKERTSFVYEHTVAPSHSYQSVLTDGIDAFVSTIEAVFDFTNPLVPINKMDLDLFASTIANRIIKLCYTENGHDQTFSGALATYPSADIGRVTWKDTGSNVTSNGTGLTTRMEHCFPVGKPPKQNRPTIPLQKVYGNPEENVTAEMSTFSLINLKLISGVKPQEPLTVNNTYGRAFSTTARVDAEYSYEDKEWNTPESGSGGGGGSSNALIRFELIDDKTIGQSTVQAVALSLANDFLYPITLLDRFTQAHVGFAPRLDPQFGPEHGYRGWAQYLNSTIDEETELVTSFYDIIKMDGPARWISGETFNEVEADAVSFLAKVFDYWGAAPNNRAPATFLTEGSTSQEEGEAVLRVHDHYNLIKGTIAPKTKFQAVYDEVRNLYILVIISGNEANPIERFGMLITDIPKATWVYDGLDSYCEHGYADQAVIVCDKKRMDSDDEDSPHQFQAVERYPVINAFWPEIIKAGTTNNEEKPVIARGYLTEWNLGDEITQTVYVITNLVYPLTIISGTSASAVTGSGNIEVSSINLLWGRNPQVDGSPSTISVANTEGWEGPAGAKVWAMQIKDGTWMALYVTCPPTE